MKPNTEKQTLKFRQNRRPYYPPIAVFSIIFMLLYIKDIELIYKLLLLIIIIVITFSMFIKTLTIDESVLTKRSIFGLHKKSFDLNSLITINGAQKFIKYPSPRNLELIDNQNNSILIELTISARRRNYPEWNDQKQLLGIIAQYAKKNKVSLDDFSANLLNNPDSGENPLF